MKWITASDFNYEINETYHARRTSFNTMRGVQDTIKGTGRFAKDGIFFWDVSGFVPVAKEFHYQLEILDESPPASSVEEAEKLYPYKKNEKITEIHDGTLVDHSRAVHIACAGMYTGEIERLKGLLKSLVAVCECEDCQKNWNEFKAKHNL